MTDERRQDNGGSDRSETSERDRLAPPGSPGGAAAAASVLWGAVAFLHLESIGIGLLVFLAVLTSLEAIAGFATERTD
ncbi:hypothetical protein [Natronorubrum texcoconense]|uniref:Uncharacterized protein n=1 Tax=Natronorubrum texcoconense TaxID=1095776 RepID=A0A1G9FR39_9EURY|nr:hypothetical protein [Natronorubrum texcoconense]SDK90878.1 hypothetical protein SAMN04515672_4249 [Natronorubrum texcoconense]